MEEWQELQQREQALTDRHRADQQALQHDFMRKHDALERQFERDRQAIETSKAQCMARMAAQAAASAVGRSDGSALPQRPAAPAALGWTRLGTALPADSGLPSHSMITADSHSDAATMPVSWQDASRELKSEAASQDDTVDDIISGIASDCDSDASGISVGEPGDAQQPSLQAAAQPLDRQTNSQPCAEQLQGCQHLPADEQAVAAHAAADAAAGISSPDGAERCVPSPKKSRQSPAASLPAASPAAATPAIADALADGAAAAGSLQIAVSQPGPPQAGRAKRVQPTRVGDAMTQPSQPAAAAAAAAAAATAADSSTAADANASVAAGPAPDAATAASPLRQATLVPAKDSEILALVRTRVPGGRDQFSTNVPELAWPLSRGKVHRLCALSHLGTPCVPEMTQVQLCLYRL